MENKLLFIIIGLIVLIAGIAIYAPSLEAPSSLPNLDQFAACLTEKGFSEYGASWCSNCSRQKALFGKSFSKINYIECPENPEKCLADKIEAYPTWRTPDQENLIGFKTLEELSSLSGCPLPPTQSEN